MKIAIINFHYTYNYGAVLQCTALKQTLENLGHEVEIINYRPFYQMQYYKRYPNPFRAAIVAMKKMKKDSAATRLIFSAKWFIRTILNYRNANDRKELKNLFEPYLKRNFKQTQLYNTYGELVKDPPKGFDAYICGSDQLWNPDVTWGIDPAYYLNFGEDVRRIAYAVSPCGLDCKKYSYEISKAGNRLDSISLREEEKRKELLEIFKGKDILVCPDPTLLLRSEDYSRYEEPIPEKEYIAFYGFDDRNNNETLMNKAIQLSKLTNLPIIDFSLDEFHWKYDKVEKVMVTPGEFLSYIKNGKYVVTNSFHGTVFSIVYNKEFYTLPKSGTSSRMVELLNRLGIERRILDNDKKDDAELDYTVVNHNLKEYALLGIDYLKSALS